MSSESKLASLLERASKAGRARPLASLAVCVLLLVPLSVLGAWGLGRLTHYGEVLPGVWINDYAAAGSMPHELAAGLSRAGARLNERPVQVQLDGAVFRLEPNQVGAKVDVAKTVASAFAAGRTGSLSSQLSWWLARFASPHELEYVVEVDRTKLEALVSQWERSAISDPPVPGEVRGQGGQLVLEEPRAGRRVDREQLAKDLRLALGTTRRRVVALATRKVEPVLTKQAVAKAFEAGRHLVRAPIQLVSRDGALALNLSREQLVRAIATRPRQGHLEVFFDPKALEAVILSDRQRLEAAPKDASFRVDAENKISIIAGQPGTRLDNTLVAEALMHAAHAPGHVGELPVDRDAEPEFTTEHARALNIVKLVAQFSTYHKCCQARVQNIHRIADILDGVVVQPGAVFSVNEKVGPRTKANGFVPAPTIVEGDMEDTVGGGVSQFATTLFNALFYGGYDIIERQPHSYWFTRYPMGHEATLSYPKPDIIFKNDTKSGLLIKTDYTDTRITVKLFGDNEGRKVKATVSPRQDIIDPPVELVADPSVEPDEEKVLDAGMVGWSVIVGRVIRFQDSTEKVEKRKVTYMPRVRRVRVHPCRIPEGEEGYTGQDCPEPADAEIDDPDAEGESATPATDQATSAETD
ncbi:MAG TPA: VanW family protein [Polyangiaceae bacterium]|nr:VanW family protein [Polyangiaceae bacterium]